MFTIALVAEELVLYADKDCFDVMLILLFEYQNSRDI